MGTTSIDDLLGVVEKLRVDQSSGFPARHQPIVLLWAIGRAAGGQPRLVRWSECRAELEGLLRDYGRSGSSPSPEYPFVALSRSGLWNLEDSEGGVPQARGSALRRWLDGRDPLGGLTEPLYELMASNGQARDKIVESLLLRYFDFEMRPALISGFQLDVSAFDGFGEVPGIAVGREFPSRRAAFDAGVHRQLQAGICGTAASGAESIVISGGYEDDLDFGDVIIYTGQGGRDERTHQQVKDQELKRGNAALVTSLVTGVPVRVIRAVKAERSASRVVAYRYDGLFRVEDYWSDTGISDFLVWRYRLRQLVDADQGGWRHEPQPPALPERPKGTEKPARSTARTQRIVRSTAVAEYVKRAHDHACQVCGLQIATPTGVYAEAAHIRGLGEPHSGPDVPANVLCLCPNHHTLFDFGMLTIADDLMVIDRTDGAVIGRLRESETHEIGRQYLTYHRDHHTSR